MPAKILVTFASKYGSTREVAETIAKTLKDKYFSVDVVESRDVKSLDGYQSIVIGTPLYAGAILPDTKKFLNRFQTSLEKTPSALFVLGPLNDSPQEIKGVHVQLEKNLMSFAWFKPAARQIFVGAMDLNKLRFPDSLIKLFRASKENPMRSSDNRDWKAIQTWAAALPDLLHLKSE